MAILPRCRLPVRHVPQPTTFPKARSAPTAARSAAVPAGRTGTSRRPHCRCCRNPLPPRDFEPEAEAEVLPASFAAAPIVDPAEPVVPEPIDVEADIVAAPRRRRGPWLLLALVVLVAILGVVAASLAFGPREVAARFGLTGARPARHRDQSRARLAADRRRQPVVRGVGPHLEPDARSSRSPTSVPSSRMRRARWSISWTITHPVRDARTGRVDRFRWRGGRRAADIEQGGSKLRRCWVDAHLQAPKPLSAGARSC